ncbi:MAG: endonuclease/exonuclease/phosphatase [Spirosoma sp.]|nr:endonuclease/exonuclease/phosphatase [Spirosoma sp.]
MKQRVQKIINAWLLIFAVASGVAWAQTPVPLASQPGATYTVDFSDIANWTNGFASGTDANRFGSVVVGGTAAIPDPTRTTTSSANFVTGTTGGVQRGTGSLVLFSTGATDNTSSVGVDFFVDFTGLQAGSLSFDAATVFNSTGNRLGTLKVYGSTNGTTFTDLGANYTATNNVAGASSVTVTIPSTFDNVATARFRLYYYNGGTPAGSTGSRPKISIDNLKVTGINDPLAARLSVTPTSLTGFAATQGTESTAQTYTLTGSGLGTDPVSVSATSAIELSIDNSSFSPTLSLPTTASAISQTIYARLTSAAPTGAFTGTISNVSGSLMANVTVTGTVSSTNPYTSIATARAGVGSTFTIQGRVTVTNQLGARQIYIQDKTGGIVVYSGPTGTDLSTLVQLGDSVLARGAVSVFSGYTEITSPAATSFTIVSGAGTVIPTPVAITPDQLPNFQGQLVSIANATITPVASTFAGGTTYTITAGGQSGTLRISANSPLSGAGQPSNPVSVTGIADRFVSGATTPGTNGIQLQPRFLADIPGSTPATDLTCTIGSGSTLTRDQTLDIAAWNMEFFGADAGTINCPAGSTLVYNDMGPANEDLQQTNATNVLTKLNADIIAVEEVSDINRFDAAVKAIPGNYSYVCSDKFSYFFQDECEQVPSGNPATVFGPTKFAQKVCIIYNTATVTPVLAETKPLLFQKTADYTYPGAVGGNGNGSGWASGRLPFLFVANVTINNVTKKVHVVAVHGKSGSTAADYSRRVQDYNDLKAELDQHYPAANVVILGDYNDKATTSIYTGSSVSSFNSFIADASNYNVITKPLEQNGCATYNPSGGSFIDHITISNDLQPAYVANTAYVLQPFSIPNYGITTSDHSPVEARFDISQLDAPVSAAFSITGVTMVSCETVTAGERRVSFTPQYSGLNSQPVSFSVVNELLPTTAPGPYTLRLYTDNPSITLKATQTGTADEASFTYNWLATCGTNNGGTTPPTSGSPFSITGVTMVSCETVTAGERRVSFTPQYSGLNGQPVSFSVVNELLPTTAPGPYTLRLYTDNPVINLKANQSGITGEASFSYNWLATCAGSNARIGVGISAESSFNVRVIGNPAKNGQVAVEVRGVAGQLLQMSLTDMRGQIIGTHQIQQADSIERHTFDVSPQSTGLLLLRVTTPKQSQTVKVIKAE